MDAAPRSLDIHAVGACGYGLLRASRHALRAPDGGAVRAWLIRYELPPFRPEAFETWDIACPDAVRKSVPKRQAEFFFGRLAARCALGELGYAPSDVGIGRFRQPLWPPGVTGSITHSNDYAAALALEDATYRGIGIDIEKVVGPAAFAAVVDVAVDASELDSLRRLQTDYPLPVLLTLAFSVKEAFFKAAFPQVGRYFDFGAVRICRVDLEARTILLAVREVLSAGLMPGAMRLAHFDFVDEDTVCTSCLW